MAISYTVARCFLNVNQFAIRNGIACEYSLQCSTWIHTIRLETYLTVINKHLVEIKVLDLESEYMETLFPSRYVKKILAIGFLLVSVHWFPEICYCVILIVFRIKEVLSFCMCDIRLSCHCN